MPKLTVRFQGKSTVVPLDAAKAVTIGRDPQNTIMLPDPALSRTHCEVRGDGGGFVVADRESKNGTTVNGQKVKEKRLVPGDRIELGQAVIVFEEGAGSSTGSSIRKLPGSLPAGSPTGLLPGSFAVWRGRGIDWRKAVMPLTILAMVAAFVGAGRWVIRHRGGAPVVVNLLDTSPSFEAGGKMPDGWEADEGTVARRVDREGAAAANRSALEVQCPKDSPTGTASCAVARRLLLEPGASYRLDGWMRGSLQEGWAALRVQYFPQEDSAEPLYEDFSTPLSRADEFERIPALALTPAEEAPYVSVACVVAGTGESATFDDLVLQRLPESAAPPPAGTKWGDLTVRLEPSGVFHLRRGADRGFLYRIELRLGTGARRSALTYATTAGVQLLPEGSDEGAARVSGNLRLPMSERRIPFSVTWAPSGGGVQWAYRLPKAAVAGVERLEVVARFIDGDLDDSVVYHHGAGSEAGRKRALQSEVTGLSLSTNKVAWNLTVSPPADVRGGLEGPVGSLSFLWTPASAGFGGPSGSDLVLRFSLQPQAGGIPTTAASPLAHARGLEDAGDLGGAWTAYQDLLKRTNLIAGEQATARKRLGDLQSAAEQELSRAESALRRAEWTGRVEDLQQALDVLSELQKKYKGAPPAEAAKARLDKSRPLADEIKAGSPRDSAAQMLAYAKTLLAQQQGTLARTVCREIQRRYPKSPWAKEAAELEKQAGGAPRESKPR